MYEFNKSPLVQYEAFLPELHVVEADMVVAKEASLGESSLARWVPSTAIR